jgi:hypothetical protein
LRATALAAIAPMLVLWGCANFGKVQQGRVIAYDRRTGCATLIRESGGSDQSGIGLLPPVTIKVPEDPNEMGPEPVAGKLILLDTKNHRLVIFDGAAQSFRTIQYTPLQDRHDVAKASGSPVVDRVRKTITIYSAAQRSLVTFAASDEFLALPPDTWKSGDVIRYYYKEPGQALRLMNVTKTDLAKSGG